MNLGSSRQWRQWKKYQKKSHCQAGVEAGVEARAREKGPRPALRQPAACWWVCPYSACPLYPLTPHISLYPTNHRDSPSTYPRLVPTFIISPVGQIWLLILQWIKKLRPPLLRWGDLIFAQELLSIVAQGVCHAGHAVPHCGHGHSSLHVSLFISVMRTPMVMVMRTFYIDIICVLKLFKKWNSRVKASSLLSSGNLLMGPNLKRRSSWEGGFCPRGCLFNKKMWKSLIPLHAFAPLYLHSFFYFIFLTPPLPIGIFLLFEMKALFILVQVHLSTIVVLNSFAFIICPTEGRVEFVAIEFCRSAEG